MAKIQLTRYLDALSGQRFDWVRVNCFTICADWVLLATGIDPALPWRGAWSSEAEARALLAREGGAFSLAARAMLQAGFPRTRAPAAGDVALIAAPRTKGARIVRGPVGAIRVEQELFAFLTIDQGLKIAPMPMLFAWSLRRG